MMNIYNLLLNYNNLMALDKLKLMLNNFPLNIIFKVKMTLLLEIRCWDAYKYLKLSKILL